MFDLSPPVGDETQRAVWRARDRLRWQRLGATAARAVWRAKAERRRRRLGQEPRLARQQRLAAIVHKCPCGEPASSRNATYCSPCRSAVFAAAGRANGSAPLPVNYRPCRTCGTVVALARSANGRWPRSARCEECRTAPRHRAVLDTRVCHECGDAFTPRTRLARFCGNNCKALWLVRRRAELVWTTIGSGNKNCPACGIAFSSRRSVQRFCTRDCSDRWHHRHDPSSNRVPIAKTVRAAVFERDAWTCYLCTRPLDRDQVAPHPLSPTIDHVRPLAMGGANTIDNLRAAHWQCNVDKGDDLPPWWIVA